MSRSLVRALAKFAGAGRGPVEIAAAPLSYSERCNLQKLRYWGLLRHRGEPGGKGGLWEITDSGYAFLSGEVRLPRFVWTFRGEPVSLEGPEVHVQDAIDGWKRRPEWARESRPAVPEAVPASAQADLFMAEEAKRAHS